MRVVILLVGLAIAYAMNPMAMMQAPQSGFLLGFFVYALMLDVRGGKL